MARTRIQVEKFDGTKLETITRHYMSTADRVAFERKFGVTSGELSKLKALYDDEGNLLPGADVSVLHEEWITFFCWRVMNREVEDQGAFDEWIDTVAEIQVEVSEEAAPDPTDQEAPPG